MHSFSRGLLLLAGGCLLPVLAQAQCAFSISPQSASFGASGGVGTVNITRTAGSNCRRSAVSNDPWITISFGQEGTDGGSAGYEVKANNTPATRTGTLTVAGQTFTILQAAGTCQYGFSPSSATVQAAGGNGSVTVSSGCPWTAATTASWLTVSGSSTTGNGTFSWSAAPNTSSTQRSGAITVGTATFTVTQSAACTFAFSPSSATAPAAGGTGTFNVTTQSACAWTATSDADWIRITSGASDTGTGTVNYTVSAYAGSGTRFGSILVNGNPFIITQGGQNCSYVFTPARGTISAAGGTGTFAVTTTCSWTATSTASWLTITAGTSGTGSGTVTYAAQSNPSSTSRGAIINVGSSQYVVDQPGQACEVFLDTPSLTFGSQGGSATVHVSTMSDCSWAITAPEWVKVAGDVAGIGIADVTLTVLPNPTIQIRTGTVTIGGKAISIRQGAATCSVSVGVRAVDAPAAGLTGTIPVSANCQWKAVPSVGWIQITSASEGSSSADVSYAVQANPDADERRGAIDINGQAVAFTQAGQRCTLTLSTTVATLPARGGSGTVSVTGGSACTWSASSNQSWLNVDWSSAGGSGVVRYSAAANTSGVDRVGMISVGGQTVQIRQPAVSIQISAAGIANAASFRGGAVAPGEIVTLYGVGFGTDSRVFFDNVPAPMIYALDGQLSCVVPYAAADKASTAVQVEYLGVKSNAIVVPVEAASPAIFTASSSGAGQGSILNQNNTINSAANPADRGSVIQIFGTGEGQTRPAGVDGKRAAAPLPTPLLPVKVIIGGIEAKVIYAGGAPGLIAGVLQVNAQVPDGVPAGDATLVLRVGDFESPATVTVAIR